MSDKVGASDEECVTRLGASDEECMTRLGAVMEMCEMLMINPKTLNPKP
jgi:hypothetical protein